MTLDSDVPEQQPVDRRTLSPEAHQVRLDMLARGMTDGQIADALGRDIRAILKWRRKHKLPPAVPRGRGTRNTSSTVLTPELTVRCRRLIERGISAPLIARETGVSVKTLERWRTEVLRQRPELRLPPRTKRGIRRMPSGRPYSAFRQPRRGQAFLLYADGLNDAEIAEVLGVYSPQVCEWRHALYLPANAQQGGISGRPGTGQKKRCKPLAAPITPMANPMHAAIVGSLARWAAPDLRDDMASEMWLALLEGRISANQIPAAAGSICNQVARDFANRFGPRSLDEDLSDDGGFKLLDLIRDDRSSSWLEEMGATVW